MPNVRPGAPRGCRSPSSRSTRSCRPTPRRGRPTWPPPAPSPIPRLPPCDEQANQVCVLAANSGDTGYGFWPGDGSDGMNGDYMSSTSHRQNQLGAAYNLVGVGVTCSGNQAWTVELFGYTYGDLPSAYARENIQNVFEGDPVPSAPVVAGTPSGDPVYCPGQTYGPNERGHRHRRPVPLSVPGAVGAGRAQHGVGPGGERGRHAQRGRLLGGPVGRIGLDARGRRTTTDRWPGRRWWRRSPTWCPPRTGRATGWWPPTAASSPSATPGSTARWVGSR